MERDAGKHRLAAVEREQIAPVVGVSLVLDRNHVHAQPAHGILDADGMMIRLDLIGLHLRIRFPQALGQPFKQIRLCLGRFLHLHVEGDINVVEGLERRALGQASRQQRFNKTVLGVIGCVLVQLLAQPADLLPILLCVLALQVHRLIGESRNVRVTDLRCQKRAFQAPCL